MFSDYLIYDPTSISGLRWKVDILVGKNKNRFVVKSGDIAGTRNKLTNYWQVRLNRKTYRIHRVIFALVHGECPENTTVDHIDGDKQNNNVTNLRLATLCENGKNKNWESSNFLPYSHISYEQNRVQVSLMISGKRYCKTFTFSEYKTVEGSCKAARSYLLCELDNFIEYGYTQRQIDHAKSKIQQSFISLPE